MKTLPSEYTMNAQWGRQLVAEVIGLEQYNVHKPEVLLAYRISSLINERQIK